MPNTNAPAWQALVAHQARFSSAHLRDLFASDPQRFERFSLELEGLLVDFSKQRIDDTTLRLLVDLAETARLGEWRARLFAGEKINFSEQRAVMHPALRYLKLGAFPSAAWDVMPEVRAVRAQMRALDRKSTRLNSSHRLTSRMPSSA